MILTKRNIYLKKFLSQDLPYNIPQLSSSKIHIDNNTKFISFIEARILFNKFSNKKHFNFWIHFYLDDKKFNCVWNNPKNYVNMFKKFNGIIETDFSLYRDWDFEKQLDNLKRNRILSSYFQSKKIKVITNMTFSDEKSYNFCFCGIPKNNIFAVGLHGIFKNKYDIDYVIKALKKAIELKNPKTIIVYGILKDWVRIMFPQINFIVIETELKKRIKKSKTSKPLPLFALLHT